MVVKLNPLGVRYAELKNVFLSDVIEITDQPPTEEVLPEGERGPVFRINLNRLNLTQLTNLTAYLARRYHVPVQFISGLMVDNTIPIQVSDVIIENGNPTM